MAALHRAPRRPRHIVRERRHSAAPKRQLRRPPVAGAALGRRPRPAREILSGRVKGRSRAGRPLISISRARAPTLISASSSRGSAAAAAANPDEWQAAIRRAGCKLITKHQPGRPTFTPIVRLSAWRAAQPNRCRPRALDIDVAPPRPLRPPPPSNWRAPPIKSRAAHCG